MEKTSSRRMARLLACTAFAACCFLAACGAENNPDGADGPSAVDEEETARACEEVVSTVESPDDEMQASVEERAAAPEKGPAPEERARNEQAAPQEEPAQQVTQPREAPQPQAQTQSQAQAQPQAQEQAQVQKKDEPQEPAAADSSAAAMLKCTNAYRKKAGVRGLSLDAALCQAAQARAEEMIATKKYEHVRPNGSSCFTVFDAYGIKCSFAGENIAGGFPTAKEACAALSESSTHYKNMVDSRFTRLGVGLAKSSTGYCCWVQLFSD